ncbi:hypothetical protein [Methylobacterium gnaphalii]|uniref:Uncharacterized protein n=1 Tax=Methylobacterium gnaphalii TaxID=1010610 RepID=A0A512JG91_9HYPH|nr:hypothetical protein [Methylobacterium gnaphalii]GEP08975.1 hypothetical protein MGN01_08200 [Methylobacterium gnaphalii]GJD67518.1 hypothetical protein MMMDOFMJ_0433 [Methylobacterium gnaphalii]GLS51427.1 hypothetical protein GCM10007885_42840 [Methylobacterium gnaphalii]
MLYRLLSVFIRRDAVAVPTIAASEHGPLGVSLRKDDPLAGLYGDVEQELKVAGYLA